MKSIPDSLIRERLEFENPWRTDPTWDLSYSKYSPRAYLEHFHHHVLHSEVRRAVVLMGPRRVGKTWMIYHCISRMIRDDQISPHRIFYVSVDHPLYNNVGLDQFVQHFFELVRKADPSEPSYVFFDEVQYLKNWEVYLKKLVDDFPNVRFAVSGSAAAALRFKSIESGAGRFTDFLLPPLTFFEYMRLIGKTDLVVEEEGHHKGFVNSVEARNIDELNAEFIKYLNFGGYPEASVMQEIQNDPARFIKQDIIDKVLLRDLPSIYGIDDIQELNQLFTTLAYNTAQEVSLSGLSKNSGVSRNTIKNYIEYLEAAFLIKVVHRVDRDGRRFKRARGFKVYLTNPSMRTALFSPVKDGDQGVGPLVETAILAQWFHNPDPIFYANWRNGEIDIVYMAPRETDRWAVEVKWSDRFFDKPAELKSLTRFHERAHINSATVTTKTKKGKRTVGDLKIEFSPASEYCYSVGRNAIARRRLTTLEDPSE